MITKIYVLCEPNGGEIRYIGKTGQSLSRRFGVHLTDARRLNLTSHLANWLRSILSTGHLPAILLIGEIEGDGCKEEIAWIAYGRSEGWRLVNGTDGGEGALGHKVSKEAREKISKALKGRCISEERKIKIGNFHRGRHMSVESRRKLSESRKGILPWTTGKHLSPETRFKISESNKGNIPQMKGKHFSAEICKKMSNGIKMAWKKRQELGSNKASFETRKKMSETHKDIWAKRKQLKVA